MGNLEAVKYLTEKGADVEKPLNVNYEKRTPLMLAAAKGHFEVRRNGEFVTSALILYAISK